MKVILVIGTIIGLAMEWLGLLTHNRPMLYVGAVVAAASILFLIEFGFLEV